MKKVMVVDDEIMVRMGMRSIVDWGALGYHLVGDASNGKEALEKIEKYQPDIVFTDLVMEPMDGLELIAACRERGYSAEFVVLSSYNDFENVKQAMKLGAVDYVFKLTVTGEELKKVLDDLQSLHPARSMAGAEVERMFYKSIPAIKTRLLRNIVENSYLSEEEMLKELAAIGVALDLVNPLAVLYIGLDDPGPSRPERALPEAHLLRYSVENIITEVLRHRFAAEGFANLDRDLVFFITAAAGPDGSVAFPDPGLVAEQFALVLEYVRRYFGLGVTGLLGEAGGGLQSIAACVAAGEDFMRHRVRSECGLLHQGQKNLRPEIAAAKTYVLQHLATELTIDTVARHVQLSKSYFSHLFKASAGVGFVNYVNQARVARACVLLQNPALRIHQVASEVGIDNYNYFSGLFKKQTGLSPAQYREKLAWPGGAES